MSALELFRYGDREVRTQLVDGEAWFVAADVCAVLDIGRVHDAMRGLDDDEKGADSIRTPGGDQRVSMVNEAGLYSLIFRSRKAEAKAFKRWVTHEVLPAIRRTGSFGSAPATDLTALARQIVAEADRADAAERRAADLERRVAGAVAALGAGPSPDGRPVPAPLWDPRHEAVRAWVEEAAEPTERSEAAGTPVRALYEAFRASPHGREDVTVVLFGRVLGELGHGRFIGGPRRKVRYRPLVIRSGERT